MTKTSPTIGNEDGFTLSELMVSVAVVSVLATFAMNNYQAYVDKSRAASTLTTMVSIRTAAQAVQLAERKKLSDIFMGASCKSCDATDGSATWSAAPAQAWTTLGFASAPMDGWGRPIILDLNEGEFNDCRRDELFSMGPDGKFFGKPNAAARVAGGDDLMVEIPLYTLAGNCPP